MGLVWVFGVLINTASGTGSLVLQYLFAITATLQGVGIFFFNVYLNTNARAETSKALSASRVSTVASSTAHSSKFTSRRQESRKSPNRVTSTFVPKSDGHQLSTKSRVDSVSVPSHRPFYYPGTNESSRRQSDSSYFPVDDTANTGSGSQQAWFSSVGNDSKTPRVSQSDFLESVELEVAPHPAMNTVTESTLEP